MLSLPKVIMEINYNVRTYYMFAYEGERSSSLTWACFARFNKHYHYITVTLILLELKGNLSKD